MAVNADLVVVLTVEGVPLRYLNVGAGVGTVGNHHVLVSLHFAFVQNSDLFEVVDHFCQK